MGDAPGQHDAEAQVDRYGQRGNQQGQADGMQHVIFAQVAPEQLQAARERFAENQRQRDQQNQGDQAQAQADQQPLMPVLWFSHLPCRCHLNRRPCSTCRLNSSTSEASRMTEAIAAAALWLNSCSRTKIISEETSVLNGILPAIMITAPNSPRLRIKDCEAPVTRAGVKVGNTT